MENNIILCGPDAFYCQPNYVNDKHELTSPKRKPIFTLETESKNRRIAKKFIAVIIFPIGIYYLINMLIQSIIMNYVFPPLSSAKTAAEARKKYDRNSDWKIKQIPLQVDDMPFNAYIMGKKSTLDNGRWVLPSFDDAHPVIGEIQEDYFRNLLTEFNANTIAFDLDFYPNHDRSFKTKAYRAVLSFLEDKKNLIKAKEIILYEHGTAIRADALKNHKLKSNINYGFITDRTFCDLSTLASLDKSSLLGFLVKFTGCNNDPYEASNNIELVPEIVLQTSNYLDPAKDPPEKKAKTDITKITNDDLISDHDGIIPKKATLAYKILTNKKMERANRIIFCIPERQHYGIIYKSNIPHLVKTLGKMMKLENLNIVIS